MDEWRSEGGEWFVQDRYDILLESTNPEAGQNQVSVNMTLVLPNLFSGIGEPIEIPVSKNATLTLSTE